MPRSEPALGTTWKCGIHGRLSIPVWVEGEKRIRHAGPGDHDWCPSQRLRERVVSDVSRDEVLATLTGNDGSDG